MSGNKKSNKVAEVVVNPVETIESVLVNQVDGTTEVLEASTPTEQQNTEVKSDYEKLAEFIMDGTTHESVETKEPNGTTTEVKKVVVPSKVSSADVQQKVIPQLLDYIFANHLNLVETITQTIKDAPSVKENMVKDALKQQEETTLAYTQLMSKGIVMPFTPEFDKLQEVMLALHHAKQAEEIARNTDLATLAKTSLDNLKTTIVKDIETIMLANCGKETTNSGGKPNTGKAFDWQSETTTSFWRNEKDLVIAPVSVKQESWLSFEYREEHELQGNWFVAFDRSTGKIAYKIPSATTLSNLYFQLTSQIMAEKGEEVPEKDTWGKNQTTDGSTTTDAQKAKYPVLTPEKLRELIGDKGTSFAHNVSVSEEIGKDDETALPVETTEEIKQESVTA